MSYSDQPERNSLSESAVRSIVEQSRNEIRNEIIKKMVGWVLAGGLAIGSLAALGAWVVIKPIIIQQIGGTPRGAVVAFDRDDLDENKCPDGWSPFLYARARVIVGAGNPEHSPEKMRFDQNGRPLKGFVLRQHEGEQTHTLTIPEMPAHDHGIGGTYTGKRATSANEPSNTTNSGPFDLRHVESQGRSEQHNILDPFIALYYCKKGNL